MREDAYKPELAPSAFHFKNQRSQEGIVIYSVYTWFSFLTWDWVNIFLEIVSSKTATAHIFQSGVRNWPAGVSRREIEVFNPQAWDSRLRRESWQVYLSIKEYHKKAILEEPVDEPACRCEELFGISEFLARPLQPKFPSVQLGPVRWTIFHLGPLVRNLFRSVPIERNKARPFQRPFCQRTTGLFPADSAQPDLRSNAMSSSVHQSYHMVDWPRSTGDSLSMRRFWGKGERWKARYSGYTGDRKRREKLRLAQAEVSNVISHKTHEDCFCEAIWRFGLCFTRENTAVLLLTSLWLTEILNLQLLQ